MRMAEVDKTAALLCQPAWCLPDDARLVFRADCMGARRLALTIAQLRTRQWYHCSISSRQFDPSHDYTIMITVASEPDKSAGFMVSSRQEGSLGTSTG
jgi:hypothetical protein